jgi:hypothetical protein
MMYPLCLVTDIFFIYRELKSLHLRTLNRERAEMLADHYVVHSCARTPADVARAEQVLLRSRFDCSGLSVRFAGIHELFGSNAELEAAAASCRGGFVLQLGRRPRRKRHAALWGALPLGRSQCFLGIALHREATHAQVLSAVLAACAARRELHAAGLADGERIGKHMHAAPEEWWPDGGGLTARARGCIERGVDYGLRHGRAFQAVLDDLGWLTKTFMLGKAERARFSTKLTRSIGGVRWLTFR